MRILVEVSSDTSHLFQLAIYIDQYRTLIKIKTPIQPSPFRYLQQVPPIAPCAALIPRETRRCRTAGNHIPAYYTSNLEPFHQQRILRTNYAPSLLQILSRRAGVGRRGKYPVQLPNASDQQP